MNKLLCKPNMNIVKAFSKIEIDSHEADLNTIYSCACGEKVRLNFKDFEKHLNLKFSNLDSGDFVGAGNNQSFIDFYCPCCGLATTVQYSLSVGGRHGQCVYSINSVVTGNA